MSFFKRNSLSFRLTSAFIAVIVSVVLAMSVFSVIRWKNNALSALRDKGATMTRLLSANARIGVFSENKEQLRDVANSYIKVRDVLFIGIYSADRKPLYLSDPAFPDSGAISESGETAEDRTLEFSRPVMLTVFSNDAASYYFTDNGTDSKELVIGYIKLVLGQETLLRGIRKILLQNMIIALFFISMSIVIVSLWVKKITKPLEALTWEVKALGKGGDVPYVQVEGLDEVGRLAQEFNTMLDERRIAEQTRKNILRDLHDGVGGMMTNIVLISEINRIKPRPDEIAKTLTTISTLARDGILEIRSLIYSLDRSDLNWPSLISEMRSLGHKMADPHAIAFKMTSQVEEDAADPGSLLCMHLFKIYREALTNVIKHSEATKILVDLSVSSERLLLVVRDDGRGCNPPEVLDQGRGVTNMRSRAAEIGGIVTINGSDGTCVSVEIPFS